MRRLCWSSQSGVVMAHGRQRGGVYYLVGVLCFRGGCETLCEFTWPDVAEQTDCCGVEMVMGSFENRSSVRTRVPVMARRTLITHHALRRTLKRNTFTLAPIARA